MKIRTGDILIENDKAWFVPGNICGIVETDLNTDRSVLITVLEGYGLFDSLICSAIQKVGDHIAVAPLLGDDLYILNLSTVQLIRYPIADHLIGEISGKNSAKFYASFSRGKKMYFVGCGYSVILIVDVSTKTIKSIKIDYKKKVTYDEDILGRAVGICGENVFIPLCNSNEFVIFDLKTEKYEIVEIGSRCCIAACGDADYMCLLPVKGGNIEIYDIKKKEVNELEKFPSGFRGEGGDRWYSTAVYQCGHIWIFPFKSNMILRLNLLTSEVICVKEFDTLSDIKYTYAGKYDENRIWGFYQIDNRLDIINCQSLLIEEKYFLSPDNLKDYMSMKVLKTNAKQAIFEDYLSLENFILHICQQKADTSKDAFSHYDNFGIWKAVKSRDAYEVR